MLGDSITQGYKAKGYRYDLWTMLLDDGLKFDFLGSMDTPDQYAGTYPNYKGKSFDQDHEGHSGWHADSVLQYMGQWLPQYAKPDIVLLHLGTNDVLQGKNDKLVTISELRQVIGKLKARNSNAIILVAEIIPSLGLYWTNPYINEDVAGYNAEIVKMVNSMADPKVVLVDMFTGFDPDVYLFDGVHPNATGEHMMAQRWRDALFAAIK
ncbi:SGNH/GDSL hydrolase family protein [Thiothrix nivea]|nr:SGNH/GDSL hydrolase family protein [Thiothrix nivea]